MRESNVGKMVIALFFFTFHSSDVFSCSLVGFYLSMFFGTIGENIKVMEEDGIDLYIDTLKF